MWRPSSIQMWCLDPGPYFLFYFRLFKRIRKIGWFLKCHAPKFMETHLNNLNTHKSGPGSIEHLNDLLTKDICILYTQQ